MHTTIPSLLERLKNAPPDAEDWHRLQEIYPPLIHSWLARMPGLREDADDLTQSVLMVVFRELPSFERRRDGAFRAWLRRITINRVRAFRKAKQSNPIAGSGAPEEQFLSRLEDPRSDLAAQWDREHDKHVFEKLLGVVERDFEPTTWKAFLRFGVDGRQAAEVARELAISESAVVQAKSRVLKRLREEAGELLE